VSNNWGSTDKLARTQSLDKFRGNGHNPRKDYMANEIIGRFYFRRTSNGNLIGEFSNNKSGVGGLPQTSTESCDLRGSDTGDYLGEYYSTWQEQGKPQFADLKISHKNGTTRLFSLEWTRSGKPIFKGEGMLCDNVLIGDYQNGDY
jgi:hypothetical protein